MRIAYLLTGSNQGDRPGNLQKAITYLGKQAGDLTKCSPVFESPPWGFEHPTPFLNQALELHTELPPLDLLKVILGIEKKCGRIRAGSGGYEARSLDIDILIYDQLVMDTAELTIPHPRLHLRRFALLPLSSIAGDLVHPQMGKSISELLSECPDTSPVEQFDNCWCNCGEEQEGSV